MNTADLVIQSARIVHATTEQHASIAVKHGKIAAISSEPIVEADEIIEAGDLVVLPGVIDPHTHMRDPGLTEAEDWTTGTHAAAIGGVTTILEHPNTLPPAATVEGFNTKKEIASAKSLVDFALIAGAGDGNLDEIEGLAAAGAVAYKTFTLPAGEPNLIGCATTDDGVLHDLFAEVARTGRPHSVHAESYPLVRHFSQLLNEQGRRAPTDHEPARPVVSELEAVLRAMTVAGATGVRLNIVHVSAGSVMDHVLALRESGLADVTIETCPHYLFLTSERMAEVGPYAKVNPPIRTEPERARLWEHFKSGAIDTIGSDHAPRVYAGIEKGWKDIYAAPSGGVGLAVLLQLLLTQVHADEIDLNMLVRMTSKNPASIYNLYPRKGAIEVGADADFTLVDLEARRTIGRHTYQTKDPRIARMWEGYETVGAPMITIVRGEVVMRDGEVLGQPGTGQFIAPGSPSS